MKILLPIDMSNPNLNVLKNKLSTIKLSSNDEVCLIHIFRINAYSDNFSLTTYPTQDDIPHIEDAVIKGLTEYSKEIVPTEVKLSMKCDFSVSPKEACAKYANDNGFDQIIIVTREKHSFFSSSFAQYLITNTNAELAILRKK